MGILCETPEPTPVNTTTQVIQNLPGYEQAAREALYAKAGEVSQEPYQPYTGPRIADFTPDQQAAFDATRGNVGAFAPGMQAAYGAMSGAATTFPNANLAAYMNPYSQNVTDIAAREAQRTWDINRQQINDAAVRAGAFGGSRHGIAEAEGQRNINQQLSDIYLKGGEAAFRNAGQLFNADADRLLKAGSTYGQLAGLSQGYGLKDAAALSTIGEAQQALGQRNLDTAYQNFLEQRNYPREQVNWLSNIIKGTSLPLGSTTTGQQLVPQSSPISQAAGLATTGLGLWGLYKAAFAEGGPVRMQAGGALTEEMINQELIKLAAMPTPDAMSRKAALLNMRAQLREQSAGARLNQVAQAPPDIWQGRGSQMPYFPPANVLEETPVGIPDNNPAASFVDSPHGRPPLAYPGGPPVDVVPGENPTPPQPRAPGSSPAGGQPIESRRGVAMPTAPDVVGDALQKPYSTMAPVTKPIDVPIPEATKLDENASPWMAITKAGLAMMGAKPGQSALAAIGEGGQAGLEVYQKDVETARKNKQINWENNLKVAQQKIAAAEAENNRATKEVTLGQADKQLQIAERDLLRKFQSDKDENAYRQGMLRIADARTSAEKTNPYEKIISTYAKVRGWDLNNLTPEQRDKLGLMIEGMTTGGAQAMRSESALSNTALKNIGARMLKIDEAIAKPTTSEKEKGRLLAQKRALELEAARIQGIEVNDPVGNLIDSLRAPPK